MHYVKKNKFKDRLIADAKATGREINRAQAQVLSIDQNNIGDGKFETLPGSPSPIHTGVLRSSVFPPTSLSTPESAHESANSATRYHHRQSYPFASPVNITETEVWTDQGPGGGQQDFTVYEAAPYLFLGQMSVRGNMVDPTVQPLVLSLSIRLNGEILQPVSTQSCGMWLGAPAVHPWVEAPLFFCATRILVPADYSAVLTVRMNRGPGIAEVSEGNIAVVGFIR
tara:strand:+ start:231 stop:908 length:678 start_codon:yes stop_codon:yes gene_type:complete